MSISIARQDKPFLLRDSVPVLPVSNNFLDDEELVPLVVDLCEQILGNNICRVLVNDAARKFYFVSSCIEQWIFVPFAHWLAV